MGLVGSLVARLLRAHDVQFTWSDIESPFTAWHASTGSVYPTGTLPQSLAYRAFPALVRELKLGDYIERAQWCYNSKNAPEKAELEELLLWGNGDQQLTVSDGNTIQLNVQAMVKSTRTKYAKRRTDGPSKGQKVIVTHGSALADRYVWGWSALVEVSFDPDWLEEYSQTTDLRPVVYTRKVYDMAYLYPQPGTHWYYGGTSTVSQRTAKERPGAAMESYLKWVAKIEERSAGFVSVTRLRGQPIEGWRPKSSEELDWVVEDGGKLFIKPQGGDGVRQFPLVRDDLLDKLGLR